MTKEELVERFLCPGCVCGSDVKCGRYENYSGNAHSVMCRGHVIGTSVLPMPGNIALGMPKGFNRPGWCSFEERSHNKMEIRLWPKGYRPNWDDFNIAVWALEREGFLFVRTGMPRVGKWVVDVIEGGKAAEMCPAAKDVTKMYDEYD